MNKIPAVKRFIQRATANATHKAARASSNAKALASQACSQIKHLFVRRQQVQVKQDFEKLFVGQPVFINPLSESAKFVVANKLHPENTAPCKGLKLDSPVLRDHGGMDKLQFITEEEMRMAEKVSVSAEALEASAVTGNVEDRPVKLPVYKRPLQPLGAEAVTVGFDKVPMHRRPMLQTAPQQLVAEAVTVPD